jgi:hypothetical protein
MIVVVASIVFFDFQPLTAIMIVALAPSTTSRS